MNYENMTKVELVEIAARVLGFTKSKASKMSKADLVMYLSVEERELSNVGVSFHAMFVAPQPEPEPTAPVVTETVVAPIVTVSSPSPVAEHVAWVESGTRAGVRHAVQRDERGSLICTCEAFKYGHGRACRHIMALVQQGEVELPSHQQVSAAAAKPVRPTPDFLRTTVWVPNFVQSGPAVVVGRAKSLYERRSAIYARWSEVKHLLRDLDLRRTDDLIAAEARVAAMAVN